MKADSKERATQAIFSVCADEAVVDVATVAAFKLSGTQFAGEFRDYISAEKRPQFSPMLKSAASCVALIDFDRDPELAMETTARLHQTFLNRISYRRHRHPAGCGHPAACGAQRVYRVPDQAGRPA